MADTGRGEPKLTELSRILEAHFRGAAADGVRDSRAIVFTSMRDGVAGICGVLSDLTSGVVSVRCAA